jgi:hypothetical protein
MNRSGKTQTAQRRKVAAMVDMGVGQNCRVNFGGIERELAVSIKDFLPPSLHQSAIKQDTLIPYIDLVHRSGNFMRGSPKSYLHRSLPLDSGVKAGQHRF